METMITFLVGFPFISALLLALIKHNGARKAITYVSSAAIIFTAVTFAITFFMCGEQVSIDESMTIPFLNGIKIVELVDYAMLAGEVFLVVLITVLSIKYKKFIIALLSIAQTGIEFWYEFSDYKIQSSNVFKVDQLTVIMVLIIAIVGTLITVYACGYMDDYHHHHGDEVKDRRSFFFAIMYVFIGAMFGLVLSNSLIWLYFFWEVTSVCSFLLIGYTKTQEAIHNCFRALWMNLLGGLAMISGIVMFAIQYNISDLSGIVSVAGEEKALIAVPVILLAFGALTKSAQLPFSKWLLGAMVAPTPSSALLHSATMVKAGVYLLIRLAPAMQGETSGYLVALIGGLTFLAMSMLAITVSDGKKVLAYSTLSNLGLITACAGIGTQETVWAAIFLVIFHAVSKSLLFQTVGAIEHQTGSRDIESMHGMVRKYPYLTWTLVVGIAGMFLAPFGMLVSKWAALKAFVDTGLMSGSIYEVVITTLLMLCICFGSATTLFYWAKWLATILASNPADSRHKNTLSKNQWTSLYIHGGLMIGIVFFFPIISKAVVNPYTSSIYNKITEVVDRENIILTILMIVFVFVVPILTYLLIAKNRPFPKAERYFNGAGTGHQNGFIDSFGNEKREFLNNWYMEDIFGEHKMYKASVLTSIGIILLFAIIAIVQTLTNDTASTNITQAITDSTSADIEWSSIIERIISAVAFVVLAPFIGALIAGIDRKITARMQGRVGPPLLQPIYDVKKLMRKQTKVINRVQMLYLMTFLFFIIITGVLFFAGFDILLVLFTLTTANVFLVIAASSGHSPYAFMGASKELVQMLAYEPMTLISAIGLYIVSDSFKVAEIVEHNNIPAVVYLPGVFLGFIYILTIKLRKHPFDLSTSHHAHQELVKGLTTEFNGKMFAIVEISHWYENVFLLGFLALFFLNSQWWSILLAIGCIIICYFLEILIDNTNARFKWKTMLNNTWLVTAFLGALNLIVVEVLKYKGVI